MSCLLGSITRGSWEVLWSPGLHRMTNEDTHGTYNGKHRPTTLYIIFSKPSRGNCVKLRYDRTGPGEGFISYTTPGSYWQTNPWDSGYSCYYYCHWYDTVTTILVLWTPSPRWTPTLLGLFPWTGSTSFMGSMQGPETRTGKDTSTGTTRTDQCTEISGRYTTTKSLKLEVECGEMTKG